MPVQRLNAREKLLDNFDQEVVEKVRIQSRDFLDRFNRRLWLLTRHVLADYARFEDVGYSFTLHANPFPGEIIHPGPYQMGKAVEDANVEKIQKLDVRLVCPAHGGVRASGMGRR